MTRRLKTRRQERWDLRRDVQVAARAERDDNGYNRARARADEAFADPTRRIWVQERREFEPLHASHA